MSCATILFTPMQGPAGPDGPRGDVGLRGVVVSTLLIKLYIVQYMYNIVQYPRVMMDLLDPLEQLDHPVHLVKLVPLDLKEMLETKDHRYV